MNDTLVHPAGDHVLTVSAGLLNTTVGEKGIVCRVGRGEFMVILLHVLNVDTVSWLSNAIV